MNTTLYSEFFTNYYKSITMWVNKAGIPRQEVEDVASSIVTTILEKDGLSKYDPSYNVKLKTYLNRYVFLTVKSYKENLLYPKVAVEPRDEIPEYEKYLEEHDHLLFDRLSSMLDGDALEFLNHAAESDDYTQARKCLSDKGWPKRRITLAVSKVRAATKLCMSEAVE